MNDLIAVILMSKILHLPYCDKFGGIVRTIQRTTKDAEGNNVVIRIPVATAFNQYQGDIKDLDARREALDCDLKKKIMKEFLPESKLLGMVYFEDNGVQRDLNRRHSSIDFYNARLRLVGWFNTKKLKNEFSNTFRQEVILEITNNLISKRPSDYGKLKLINVTVDSVPELNASIFSGYDLNEQQTQFITPPYEFIAIDFNVAFGVVKNCIFNFTPEEIIC